MLRFLSYFESSRPAATIAAALILLSTVSFGQTQSVVATSDPVYNAALPPDVMELRREAEKMAVRLSD